MKTEIPKGATHKNIQSGMYYMVDRFDNDKVLFWHSQYWSYSAFKAEDLNTNDFVKVEK